ncbi:unnamed protein product [Victoria cruziana]
MFLGDLKVDFRVANIREISRWKTSTVMFLLDCTSFRDKMWFSLENWMQLNVLTEHMARISILEIKQAQKAEGETADLKGSMRKRMEFLDLD